MAIEYLGLSDINGPLVVLEGVQGASYDEIVEFSVDRSTRKLGRIIEAYADKAVIQVFEGSAGMSLTNTRTRLTGHPMEITLSRDILGRVFDGIGRPADGLGPIESGVRRNVNGLPLNPCRREYPRNYINTGISAIDTLTTLIRGQKLPIFSGNGLPHDRLAAQIVRQANIGGGSGKGIAEGARGGRIVGFLGDGGVFAFIDALGRSRGGSGDAFCARAGGSAKGRGGFHPALPHQASSDPIGSLRRRNPGSQEELEARS